MLTRMWNSWRLPVQPARTPVHPVAEGMYHGRQEGARRQIRVLGYQCQRSLLGV